MSEAARAPRRARLYLTRVDAWSVAKAAFLLALTLGIVMVIAVIILWLVLSATGVFDSISRTIDEVVGSGSTSFSLQDYIGLPKVLGVTLVIASVEIILTTILATLLAVMYNISTGLTGGVEVVLSDDI